MIGNGWCIAIIHEQLEKNVRTQTTWLIMEKWNGLFLEAEQVFSKCSKKSSTSLLAIQTNIPLKSSPSLSQMVVIKMVSNNKGWLSLQAKVKSLYTAGGWKLVQPLWNPLQICLKTLKADLPYVQLFKSTYTRNTRTTVFTFTEVKWQNQPVRPATQEWGRYVFMQWNFLFS